MGVNERGTQQGPLTMQICQDGQNWTERGLNWPQVYETSLARRVSFRAFDAKKKAGRINLGITCRS